MSGTNAIEASGQVPAPAAAVFEYLSSLDNHWRLADRWIEVLSLDGAPEAGPDDPPDRGRVRMRAPLGLSRTVVTRVLASDPPTSMAGSASIGARTMARVSWTLDDHGEMTWVHLAAELESASYVDRVLLALGGREWLRRRFSAVLGRLAGVFADDRERQDSPLGASFDRA